jgi:hypothetical protein
MWKRNRPAVPVPLQDQIEVALERVRQARAELTVAAGVPARRQAHARLGSTLLEADQLLREAVRLAKCRSRAEWRPWRHRLAVLDTERQHHLFEELDEFAILPIGSIRAIDTGMSGPAIGDHLHGRSSLPGTPPRYGVDHEAVLLGTGSDLLLTVAEPVADVAVLPVVEKAPATAA